MKSYPRERSISDFDINIKINNNLSVNRENSEA